MAEPFLAETRMFSFNFAPKGWAFCNGQLLPINQNQALFSLLGTTYGGDGRTTFALPDLRSRAPIHFGGAYALGQKAGAESHTLSIAEMPEHTHAVRVAASVARLPTATNSVLGQAPMNVYSNATVSASEKIVPMNPAAVAPVGGSQPHENRQPLLALTICIALQGIFPSPN